MARRLLPAATAAMALAGLACAGSSTSTQTAATPAPTPQTIAVTESEFKIVMPSTSLKTGTYVFQVQNAGKVAHDIHIAKPDGSEVARSDQVAAGQSGTFQVTLKPGTYIIFCSVEGHRGRGMEGTLTVQ